MFRFFNSVASFIIVATACGSIANAQGQQNQFCAQRTQLVKQLENSHGERQQNIGLQQNAGVIETFANTDTGTWTIFITLPSGVSCLIAAGEAFQPVPSDVSMLEKGA
ncbi:MAG: hypothetical protein ACPGGK_13835 [Pikeienuella sp.]